SGGGLGPVSCTGCSRNTSWARGWGSDVPSSDLVAGGAISPAVQLSALDPAGNLVPTFTGSVTVALGNNPGGSTLSGTTTVAAVRSEERRVGKERGERAPGDRRTETGMGTGTMRA